MLVNAEGSQLFLGVHFGLLLHVNWLLFVLFVLFFLLLCYFGVDVVLLLLEVFIFDFVLCFLLEDVCEVTRFGSHLVLSHFCYLLLRKLDFRRILG
jgi:hypothetical protein